MLLKKCGRFVFSTSNHHVASSFSINGNAAVRFFSEYEIVVAGGGAGGISTAARLSKVLQKDKIVIIDRAVVKVCYSSTVVGLIINLTVTKL